MYSTKKIDKVAASTERLDASISSKHSDYGSTTLKNRAFAANPTEITPSINITTNEGALDSNEHNDSDCTSSSAAANDNEVANQNLPAPTTTYTSTLFAAACGAPSTSRFKAHQARYPRYAYSRMETYIDEKPGCEKSRWTNASFHRFETFLFVLNQMCIGFVTIYMSWLCLSTGLQKTSLHAWLVTLGYSLMMAEAIIIHYNANPLTSHYKRHEKHTIHWVLQLLGGGLGMSGILYKCIQKGFLLTSTHGKLGFAAFILCLVSWLSGLTALYHFKLKSYVRPLFNRTFHNLIGFTCFALALLSQYYGYESNFFKSRTTSASLRDCIKAVTLISLGLNSIGPIKALLQKARTIFRG